jgi:Putative transposase
LLNVHAHTLALDGVFTEAADGTLRFHPAPPPTDAEVARLVARLVATIRTRVLRLLRRRGVLAEMEDSDAPDPLAASSLVLAGIASAAVQGRSALGPRAGARPPTCVAGDGTITRRGRPAQKSPPRMLGSARADPHNQY